MARMTAPQVACQHALSRHHESSLAAHPAAADVLVAQAPLATGRAGSLDQADHDPG